jgi:hypothetical protein
MTDRRRALALLLAPAIATAGSGPPSPAPTDVDRLNSLAGKYNHYVDSLRNGIVDVKQWERVRKAWEALT